jgi:hypothetical protein
MEAGSGTTGGFHGGQTGSLTPCSTPPQFSAGGGVVPEGDAAFVFRSGCPAGEGFSVLDENGTPVSFQLEELDDDVVLLRTESTLTPGSYTVTTPDGKTSTVVVSDAVPLPSDIGWLRHVDSCSNLVELVLSEEVLPYLPLLRLEYSIDGLPFVVWFEYGTVPTGDLTLQLALDSAGAGTHEVRVSAVLAGESVGPEPEGLVFTVQCQQPQTLPGQSPPPDSGGAANCSLAGQASSSVTSGLMAILSLILVWMGVGWRRRRRKVS